MDVWIKKYRGTNYFYDAVYADQIYLETLPAVEPPVFDFENEAFPFTGGQIDKDRIGRQQSGDFTITISMLQKNISAAGKTVRQFFVFDEDPDEYFYLVIIKSDGFYAAGMTVRELYRADFTITQNKDFVYLTVFEPTAHWSRRVDRAPLSTLDDVMSNGAIYSFEEYIHKHFEGLTSGKVLLGLPPQTYLSKLQPYGTPAGCWAYGDFFQFINDRNKISRWEAFKELQLGIGFNYKMYLNPGTEVTSVPEFIFEIFFLADLANTETSEISGLMTHEEEGQALSAKWVFLKYRSYSKDGIDYSSGIIFSNNQVYDADPNQGHDQLYPALLVRLDGRLLSYTENGNTSLLDIYSKDDFLELTLKQYSYSHSSGGPIGKTGDPNPVTNDGFSASFAYSKIFNAATGSGTNIDLYNHKPIQRFAAQNYKRFLDTHGRKKIFTISLLGKNPKDYMPWNNYLITENGITKKYFISRMRDYNIQERKCVVELKRF